MDDKRSSRTLQSGVSGSISISERVAMGIISLLLSFLSFGGGYFYGAKSAASFPVESGVEMMPAFQESHHLHQN